MSIVNDIRINEAEYDLENGEKGKLAVFFYSGDKDPRKILDHYTKLYAGDNHYYDLIDAQLNCPWVRVILSDINKMKQENFNDYIEIRNINRDRLKKLKKLNENW